MGTFHCLSGPRKLLYVCMVDQNMLRRLSFGFLEDVGSAFEAKFTQDEVDSAIAYSMSSRFEHILRKLMEKYNVPDADRGRVATLSAKVKEISNEAEPRLASIPGLLQGVPFSCSSR